MFNLRSGNKPEFRKLSGVASPNKKVDATAVTDKLKDKVASVANVKDKLSNVKSKAADVKNKLSNVKDSKVGEKLKSKVVSKGTSKAITKGLKKAAGSKILQKGGKRAVLKAGAKLSARAIPPAGLALGAYDAGKFMMETRAKGYAALDKKSPGTSRRLETGAYGMQSGTEGGKKVRGTFFGSMK